MNDQVIAYIKQGIRVVTLAALECELADKPDSVRAQALHAVADTLRTQLPIAQS